MKSTLTARLAAIATPLLLGLAAPAAQASLIQIDSSQSHATYQSNMMICDMFFNCTPAPQQTFSLSGILQVGVQRTTLTVGFLPTDPTIDLDLIRFTPVAVNLGGADALGFDFPDFDGILNGNTYQGSSDPCTLPRLQGMNCMSLGPFSQFEATYDGQTLTLTGTDPNGGFFDNFQYRIVGQTIPEPGTLSLLALGGLGLMRRRQRMPV